MSGDPFWLAIEEAGLLVPEPVATLHKGHGTKVLRGECAITRGGNPLVRLALWLGGFPPAGQGVPVRLVLSSGPDCAIWQRDFAGHETRSRIVWDAVRSEVVESFGPFEVHMALSVAEGQLLVRITRLSVLGIGLPAWMRPRSQTREYADDQGRFCFDVSASAPGLGLIIRYHGWVVPEA